MSNASGFYIDSLVHTDAKNLFSLINENSDFFGKYLPITLAQNKTLVASEAYIARKAEEKEAKKTLTLSIKEKETNAIAGLIILKNINLNDKHAELAYCMGAAFNGRGWTTEAVRRMSQHAAETLGIKTLQIITHKTNIGSCKVAEKTGFIWQRTLKKEFTPPNGKALDMELYELSL